MHFMQYTYLLVLGKWVGLHIKYLENLNNVLVYREGGPCVTNQVVEQ